MMLAAFSLIVLLTVALVTSVALIAHDLAVEQRHHAASDDPQVPLAA
jgi:hypothetical protein